MVEEAQVCVYKPWSTPCPTPLPKKREWGHFSHLPYILVIFPREEVHVLGPGGSFPQWQEAHLEEIPLCLPLRVTLLSLPYPNLRTKIHAKSLYIYRQELAPSKVYA